MNFSDNSLNTNNDRLLKVSSLLDELLGKLQQLYTSRSTVVFDVSPVLFRGRLIVKQFTPGKFHKYGCKLYNLCCFIYQTCIIQVYAGKCDTVFFIWLGEGEGH